MMYCYYVLALRNKRFHQYNRWYLLSSVALSFVIPLIKIEFWKETQQSEAMKVVTFVYEADAYVAKNTSFWNWDNVAMGVLGFISFVFLSALIVSLIKIYVLVKTYPHTFWENICFVFSNTPGTPFSFFKYIFWNKEIDVDSSAGQHILKHEVAHVQEKHSADKLFLSLMLIVGWCNPFLWLIRKELNMIHEFIADQKAVSDGDAHSFATMLLKATYPAHSFMPVNLFFHSPIKRRLIMLTTITNPRYSYIRRIMVLPLLTVVILFFSFRYKERKAVKEGFAGQSSFTVPVVLDSSAEKLLPGLVILDGKKMTLKEFENKLKEFENRKAPIGFSSSTIMGGKELEKYGEEGKNGVAIFTTKPIEKETVITDTPFPQKKFDKVFTRVENPPVYGNGNTPFSDFIKANLQYPTKAINNKTEGKVVIKFIVDEEGNLSNFEPLTSLGNGLEEEAIRLIKNSTPWKPAIQNGRKVAFEVKQEIDFVLSKQTAAQETDEDAQFPGGADAWRRYLEKNLDANVLAKNGAPAGQYPVKLTFNVHAGGSITNVVAKTSNGYGSEEEAIKLIKKGPKWVPAKKDGSFVDSEVNQTITFMVAEN